MAYFLYILKSKNYSKSYVGISQNPEQRLKEHNAGKSRYTKRYMPWKLIYVEKFDSRKLARKREKYYKSAAGRRALRKIFDKIK